MTRRSTLLAAALLVAGAASALAAFAGLGVVFDYPAILRRPPAEVLDAFRGNEPVVVAWFLVLAVSAGLLAPIALLVGGLSNRPAMRLAVWAGVSAAIVQVVGLLRWPLIVPGIADRLAGASDPAVMAGALADFDTVNRLLGSLVGETLGYLLTAAWTILVLVALGRSFAGRWFVGLGGAASALIALGVLAPLGVPGADAANFAGYVLWIVWLVAFAAVLTVKWRRAVAAPASSELGYRPRRSEIARP